MAKKRPGLVRRGSRGSLLTEKEYKETPWKLELDTDEHPVTRSGISEEGEIVKEVIFGPGDLGLPYSMPIEATLAHEIGHIKLGHLRRGRGPTQPLEQADEGEVWIYNRVRGTADSEVFEQAIEAGLFDMPAEQLIKHSNTAANRLWKRGYITGREKQQVMTEVRRIVRESS